MACGNRTRLDHRGARQWERPCDIGRCLALCGRTQEVILLMERAMRPNSRDPFDYPHGPPVMRQYEEAVRI